MRKLYNEFFHIPKHGKVREKVMLTRIVTTVTIVIMCLAAMSFTAYAYFSYNITSGSNIIKSADFATNVGIKIESANGENVEVRTSNHISHEATLIGGKTYFITLQHTNQSTAQTGFVIITAKDCDNKYHTQQIGRNEDATSKTVTFKLYPTADTVVTFLSHWGTSCNYPDFKNIKDDSDLYIQDGETIKLLINPVTENKTPDAESTTPAASETAPSTPNTTLPPATVTNTPTTTGGSEPTSTTEPSTSTTVPTTQQAQSTEAAETETAEPTEAAATATPTANANE